MQKKRFIEKTNLKKKKRKNQSNKTELISLDISYTILLISILFRSLRKLSILR